jgi:pimeloyl-ACP methyl ester carboxylesterase
MLQRLFIISGIFLLSVVANGQEVPSAKIVKKGSGKQNIILISGLACSEAVWDGTVEILSKTATTYSISFAGFAGNTLQQNPNLNTWENDITDFIKSNKIANPILIGHSLGGVIALELAANYPDVFSKVIIIDAFPCISALYNPNFKAQTTIDLSPIIKQFSQMTGPQFSLMHRQMVADTSKLPVLLNWSLKSDPKTMGYMYGTLLNTDLRTQIGNITCPILILLQPAMKAKENEIKQQYSLVKNANIQFASKGLHFIMYDDKDWYLSTLQSFLR